MKLKGKERPDVPGPCGADMGKILENIRSPQDLRQLDRRELETLCEEMREAIIQTVSDNGGHLASNLGVVELTVAL